jgi:uncharacterized membrane protein
MSDRMPLWKLFIAIISIGFAVIFALIQFVLTLSLIPIFGWALHVMFHHAPKTRVTSS